jgi:cysteinyl-tRNA synthetase
VSLHLYDSLTRRLQRLEPLQPGRVGIYVCGPTVQAPPHVGHVRSAIVFDQLRRWLGASGFDVTYIRNVTDIDDKILHDAGHEDIPWWQLAERNTRHFTAAYDAVGCLPATYEPRATGHVPEMIVLMDRLIESGHAYASGGDVYFDVRSMPTYGALSGQRPDAMMATEKVDDERPKRDPLDFALWKGAKLGEPSWPTPWGAGRPGWHLECSAMATKYLGPTFDIHGGGLDLVFPHHENERAQSKSAGDPFAQLWMHHGLLNIGGEKMSKSLGNSFVAADVLERVRPQVLRYYLGGAHYRSTLDYTEDGLVEAAAAYGRIETFVRNALEVPEQPIPEVLRPSLAWQAFSAGMDDDLALPAALAAVHQAVRSGNAALADGDYFMVHDALRDVRRMLTVLGLDPVSQWPPTGVDPDVTETIDALVRLALAARADARTRKDFAAADAVRDQLVAAGIHVEDTAEGPRWRLRGEH